MPHLLENGIKIREANYCMLCGTLSRKKLFRIPRCPNMRELWKTMISKFDDTKNVTPHFKVCIDHFETKYLCNEFRTPDSIPTLFTKKEIEDGKPEIPVELSLTEWISKEDIDKLNVYRLSTRKRFDDRTVALFGLVSDHTYVRKQCYSFKLPDDDLNQPWDENKPDFFFISKMCRTCLATDNEIMYSLKGILFEEFQEILSITIKEGEPDSVCWECKQRLMTALRFKRRAVRAHQLITSLTPRQDYVTLQDVNMYREQHNVIRSEFKSITFETINIPGTDESEKENEESENNCDSKKSNSNVNITEDNKENVIEEKTAELNNFDVVKMLNDKINLVQEKAYNPVSNEVMSSFSLMREMKKNFACGLCGRTFASISNRKHHRNKHHPQNIEQRVNSMMVYCDKCENYFSTKNAYLQHTKPSHPSVKRKKKTVLKKVTKRRKCEKTKKKIKPHSIICEECGDKLPNLLKYRIHFQFYHPGKKSTQYPLNMKHMCERCGKTYPKLYTLNQHLLSHDSPTYICDYCGKSLGNKKKLRKHMEKHTGKDLRYMCQVCSVMITKDNFYRHSLTHETLPVKCSLCHKLFATRKYLRKHVKRNH